MEDEEAGEAGEAGGEITNAQCPMPYSLFPIPHSPLPNLTLSGCSIHLEPLSERLRLAVNLGRFPLINHKGKLFS
ncbi:hypothetical protein H1Q63_03765 [Desmonostoc muscorum CCALA 125]|nr:hypothetical protein [Desmonostoc muscorum CCALA 125]